MKIIITQNRKDAQFRDMLEQIIDEKSLEWTVRAISEICHEKADHIVSNWQDKHTAADWSVCGNYLASASNQCRERNV